MRGTARTVGRMYATALLQGGANPHTLNSIVLDYILGVPLKDLQPDVEDIPNRFPEVKATLKRVSRQIFISD